MKRTTIKDIANILHVNPSTVSRALAGHKNVSPSTKESVLKVAQELGYRPNRLAQNFRTSRSGLIALIIPEMNMFFFPEIIKTVEDVIRQKGYNLIVLQSNNSLQKEKENINFCIQFAVDGILVALSCETENLDHFQPILKREIPLVLFDKVIKHPAFSTFTINGELAATKAVDYLVDKGLIEILGLFGNPNLTITQQRKKGFIKSMKSNNVHLNPSRIIHANTIEETITKLSQYIESNKSNLPNCLFAMSDELLVGAFFVLQKYGIAIPKEMSVLCISEGHAPNFLFPKVTYIKHSAKNVGQQAAMFLLNEIIMESHFIVKEQIELELIEQDSIFTALRQKTQRNISES